MTEPRLDVLKTYKLFIGGGFPRSESGRSLPVAAPDGRVLAHIAHASRKDLRDAVEAGRKAQPGWGNATAYNRGQVLYRMAEMLEGKREELAAIIVELAAKPGRRRSKETFGGSAASGAAAEREVGAAVDRLVCFGGWADKYAQVLGCNNPVAGPYYNFTVPEPSGVVGVIAPDEPALLGLVSLVAPPLCAGNTIVAVASEANPLIAAVFGEVCATSDVPPGVVNILTGQRGELVPHFASHREIDAIHAAGVSADHARTLRDGSSENLKRVCLHQPEASAAGTRSRKSSRAPAAIDWFDDDACHSPWWIEPFVDMKTMWHPSGT